MSGAIWMAKAIDVVRALPPGWTGTGEDVRFHVSNVVGAPPSSNAWGTLVLNLRWAKVLYETGEQRRMLDPASHGRRTPVYRRPEVLDADPYAKTY